MILPSHIIGVSAGACSPPAKTVNAPIAIGPNASIYHGDCLDVLRTIPDNSVDAIVTDPPYGLGKEPDAMAMLKDWMLNDHHEVKGSGFMGKKWDAFVPQPAQWKECLRVLKPGGYLLSFAGTRTQDLVALGLRLAGFEIRDMIAWVYGSGFPKSLDVSKAIDKMAGAERETGPIDPARAGRLVNQSGEYKTDAGWSAGGRKVTIDPPSTDAAKQWDGWGTALKPALEPITLARKPLIGTVAANVLQHGTGALNIDGCRVGITDVLNGGAYSTDRKPSQSEWVAHGGTIHSSTGQEFKQPEGRWPANLIHDGSDEVLANFPTTTSGKQLPTHKRHKQRMGSRGIYGASANVCDDKLTETYGDTGSAARFFYCAKTNKQDRNEGCENLPDKEWSDEGACIPERDNRPFNPSKNNHPTVKPTDLMRYLCRLVTPPGGTVLDPFMGSGSTGKAAVLEGFGFIGIEMEAGSVNIAQARIAAAALATRSQ